MRVFWQANALQRAALLIFLFSTSKPVHAYSFSDMPIPGGCPFMHQDPYQLEGLLTQLKVFIETKNQSENRCAASIQSFYSSLLQYQTVQLQNNEQPKLTELKVSYQKGILNNLEANQLALENRNAQLSQRLATLTASGQTQTPEFFESTAELNSSQSHLARITSSLTLLDSNLAADEMLFKMSSATQSDTRYQAWKKSVFQSIEQSLSSINRDPYCMRQAGGAELWAPLALHVAGLTTAASGIPSGDLIGLGLMGTAEVLAFLRNGNTRNAWNEINDIQNEQAIACVYYSYLSQSCKLGEAIEASKNISAIKQLMKKRFSIEAASPAYQVKVEAWDQLLALQEFAPRLSNVFEKIGAMASPLTLDNRLLISYMMAKKINPAGLPTAPGPDASETEQFDWLQRISIAGIQVNSSDRDGRAIPIRDQITDAKSQISSLLVTIASVEAKITETLSFMDLRTELDKDIGLQKQIKTFLDYINAWIAVTKNDPELKNSIGGIDAFLPTLEALNQFLSISLNNPENLAIWKTFFPNEGEIPKTPRDVYRELVNHWGYELFTRMTKGAVAQIDSQSVLVIGKKSTDRLMQVLALIERSFVVADLNSGDAKNGKGFLNYKRTHEVYDRLLQNTRWFDGQGMVFRMQQVSSLEKAFKEGFGWEIDNAVDRALKQSTLDAGSTASQLCVLFLEPLSKSWRGAELLKQCRQKFSSLKMISHSSSPTRKINWNNRCEYVDYSNDLEISRILVELERDRL